jgi:ADP-ribose pyrophosphatase YjhB (NUDIX family)
VPRFRPAARLIVLDPADPNLLFSATDPRGQVWFTPGGGVHRGESLEAAAARELAEEPGQRRRTRGTGAAGMGLRM